MMIPINTITVVHPPLQPMNKQRHEAFVWKLAERILHRWQISINPRDIEIESLYTTIPFPGSRATILNVTRILKDHFGDWAVTQGYLTRGTVTIQGLPDTNV